MYYKKLSEYFIDSYETGVDPTVEGFLSQLEPEDSEEGLEEIEMIKEFKALFQSALQFYLGYPTSLSDKEYDSHRRRLLNLTGKDILDLIHIGDGKDIAHPLGLSTFLSKEALEGDFAKQVEAAYLALVAEHGDAYMSPKYDGGSLVLNYNNGRYTSAISWSNGESGKNNTQKFRKFVPDNIDPRIKSIQCEVMVSYDLKHLLDADTSIRNKANGLLNSKHDQEGVDKLATLRAFKINLDTPEDEFDYELTRDLFLNLDSVFAEDGRILFQRADILVPGQIPETDIYQNGREHFLVDGVVIYTPVGSYGYKFYYTNSAEVVISNADWAKSWSEGWSPVAEFPSVNLQEANISRASMNGVQNMLELKIGIGTRCKLIRANSTIPKLIEVLGQPDNMDHDAIDNIEKYNFPKCGCGNQLLPTRSMFGNSLKCELEDCSEKLQFRKDLISGDADYSACKTVLDFEHVYVKFPHLVWTQLLNIDRFNPDAKYQFKESTKLDQYEDALLHGDQDIWNDSWIYDPETGEDLVPEDVRERVHSLRRKITRHANWESVIGREVESSEITSKHVFDLWMAIVKDKDYESYRGVIENLYHFSDLQWSMATMNVKATVDAWHDYITNLN